MLTGLTYKSTGIHWAAGDTILGLLWGKFKDFTQDFLATLKHLPPLKISEYSYNNSSLTFIQN